MTNKDDLFLVTGATGKTGAHTVRLLRERGLRVRALVHSLDGRADRLGELGAELVQGDLLDFPSVSAATAGVTAGFQLRSRGGACERSAIIGGTTSARGPRRVSKGSRPVSNS